MNEKKNLNMNENGAMSHRITLSMVECEVAGLPRWRDIVVLKWRLVASRLEMVECAVKW